MRRNHLVGAVTAALVLAVAVAAAYANAPASLTTFDTTSKATPKKSGTKKKPKPTVLTLTQAGDTNPPGGSPATSTDIIIQLPSTLKWYGDKWPGSKQCDNEEAELQKTDSVCPKGSKVGTGHVRASNQSDPTKPKILEEIDLTAYVLTGGRLGLWLEATQPVPITTMLVGKISKKKTNIAFFIPENVQEPVKGVNTGIEQLDFKLNGKVKRKGKTWGAISSVGCKGKSWKVTTTNVYRPENGVKQQKKDTAKSKCSAPKKKR